MQSRGTASFLRFVVLIAEQERDAPKSGDAYQGIDDAAESAHLAAAQESHAVKTEQTYASPVQRANDD